MIKDKSKLANKLEKIIIEHIVINKKICEEVNLYANNKYDLPIKTISDYIYLRKSLNEANDFVLFCLIDSINNAYKNVIELNEYYSSQEIRTYSNSKHEVNKISFPLRFKMLQIDTDQWIGKIGIKELMALREAQLINYNTNAQRTMQRIIKGDKEIYKITLNKSAVSSIKKSLENNQFVPNTLTFNIPEEDMDLNEFSYDEDGMELVITKLDHFDIIDGYHRYIAISEIYDASDDMDYTFELRITNFNEEKTKKFIYQEDQKTKMKKIDSKSMDMNSASNIIVKRINDSSSFNLMGCINRNGGLINYGELAILINVFYLSHKIKKANANKMILETTKSIINDFNGLTEYDEKYLERRYSYEDLAIIMFVLSRHNDENKYKIIDKMLDIKFESLKSLRIYNRISGVHINDMEKAYQEVKENVQ